mgnify:CR=1 FL=1
MSKGSSSTVQKADPWSGQQPYLTDLYSQAQSQLQAGPQQFYPNKLYADPTQDVIAAEEMARIVGDTLEGAFKRAESATQGFQIVLIEKFGDALKSLTNGFANFLNNITDFLEIPLSKKIDEDRVAMNDLFNTLKKTNLEEDTRNKLIA